MLVNKIKIHEVICTNKQVKSVLIKKQLNWKSKVP